MVKSPGHGRSCTASMGPRLMSRGYLRHRTALKLAVPFASMGPRLMSRGYYATQNADKLGLQGFNGAAADEPRILSAGPALGIPLNSFNGAAADEPRIHQLGWQQCHLSRQASMGPRLMSRGYITISYSDRHTSALQWGRG